MTATITRIVPDEPQEQTNSLWRNPTNQVVRCDFWVGHERARGHSGRIRYSWEPNETKSIPSEFDAAIHHVNQDGIVVGGLAPQLRKQGVDYQIHPALDVAGQAKAKAAIEAMNAAELKKTAEAVMLMAAQKAMAADAELQKNDEPHKKGK